jgi:hypothetical protein
VLNDATNKVACRYRRRIFIGWGFGIHLRILAAATPVRRFILCQTVRTQRCRSVAQAMEFRNTCACVKA